MLCFQLLRRSHSLKAEWPFSVFLSRISSLWSFSLILRSFFFSLGLCQYWERESITKGKKLLLKCFLMIERQTFFYNLTGNCFRCMLPVQFLMLMNVLTLCTLRVTSNTGGKAPVGNLLQVLYLFWKISMLYQPQIC